MLRRLLLLVSLAPLLVGTAGLLGCTGRSSSDPTGEKSTGLRVLATSGPVGDAVRNVLGEYGTVEVMMGPGIDPHLYQEKPADLRKLSDAHVVFYNGLHFEGIHDTLVKLGKKKPVFAVAEKLHESKDTRLRFPEGLDALPDPHIWHDASVWADCVLVIAEKLAEVDSEHADSYRSNAAAYRQELLKLHQWCKSQIDSIPTNQRLMVTAHDAFGYYSDAYGIKTKGLKGVSTEDEIDLGHMQSIVDLVVEKKLPAVFVESSVAPRIVEAIVEPCQAEGHTVRIGGELFADALGDAESGADTYLRMMVANTKTIVDALGGSYTQFSSSNHQEFSSSNPPGATAGSEEASAAR